MDGFRLVRLRRQLPALTGEGFEELPTGSATAFAYRRWQGDQSVIVVLNLGEQATSARLRARAGVSALRDLLTGERVACQGCELNLDLPPYAARVLLVKE